MQKQRIPVRLAHFLWAMAASLCMASAHAIPSAQEILAASDAVRNPEKPFGVTAALIAAA